MHAKLRRAQAVGDHKQRNKIHGMGIPNGLGLPHDPGAVGAMVALNLNPHQAGVGAGEVCRKRLRFDCFYEYALLSRSVTKECGQGHKSWKEHYMEFVRAHESRFGQYLHQFNAPEMPPGLQGNFVV